MDGWEFNQFVRAWHEDTYLGAKAIFGPSLVHRCMHVFFIDNLYFTLVRQEYASLKRHIVGR